MNKAPTSSGKKKGTTKKNKFHAEMMRMEEELKRIGPISVAKSNTSPSVWANFMEIQKNYEELQNFSSIAPLSASKSVQVNLEERDNEPKAKKLLNYDTPDRLVLEKGDISDIEECSNSKENSLNDTLGIDPINDSTTEFNQFENMCADSPVVKKPSSNDNEFDKLRAFIAMKYKTMQASIATIMQKNNDDISAKIDVFEKQMLQPKAQLANKENIAKPKATDLRRNLMKKSITAKCPDTPGTKLKMKKVIDLYKSMNDGLDSPRLTRCDLRTPKHTKVNAKKALSLKLQRQCFDLLD